MEQEKLNIVFLYKHSLFDIIFQCRFLSIYYWMSFFIFDVINIKNKHLESPTKLSKKCSNYTTNLIVGVVQFVHAISTNRANKCSYDKANMPWSCNWGHPKIHQGFSSFVTVLLCFLYNTGLKLSMHRFNPHQIYFENILKSGWMLYITFTCWLNLVIMFV